jgi:trk system potassium uptake protein TrkA
VQTKPPASIVGKALGEAQVRKRFRITVVCIKPDGQSFTHVTPETVVGPTTSSSPPGRRTPPRHSVK